MEVSGFRTRVVSVPRDRGPVSGGPSGESASFVLLSLWTGDGIEGIGYAGFTSHLMLKALKESVDALAEQVIGQDPMMVEAIGASLLVAGGGGSPAGLVTRSVAAIDVALWDIRGKALGQPVYKLLGGYRDSVPTYASGHLWRSYDLDALSSKSAELVQQGFKAMKFRMGGEDTPAKEIARIRVMREAVGDDIDLMVDINQGWSVNQSIAIGREMANHDLFWLEDPTSHQDYEGLARIADALDTPIAAGEYHYGIAPFRYMLEHRSVDIVMIDLLRAGGLTQWIKIAHMAEAFNLPVVSHLAPEILVHGVAAVPNGLTVELMPWAFPLFQEVPKLRDGRLVLPKNPGLGLELDEDAVKRFEVN